MSYSGERWRAVVGWEGWYEISSHGRVRRIAAASGTHVGLALTPQRHRDGYLHVGLQRHNLPRTWVTIHRLVLFAFRGPPAVSMEARHLNGKRDDCFLSNLRWGTKKENMADKRLHGTIARFPGERNANSKLTENDIRKIRVMAQSGTTQRAIAKQFNVSFQHISDVVNKKRWEHLL